MNVIILGATGYLGSRVVRELLQMNRRILCLRRSQSSMTYLKDIEDQIDFCDIGELASFLGDCEEVYYCFLNLAGRYPRDVDSEIDIFRSNLFVPLDIFLKCLKYGVRRFVTVGTGLSNEFNAYAISKNKFAEICRWYGEQYHDKNNSLQICNVELENFYGEDEPLNRFIPNTVRRLKRNEPIYLTTGNQKRDFIYVGDVVHNLIKIMDMDSLPEYLDLPLGTGEGVPVREVIEYLKEIIGSESELCFGAVGKRPHEQDSYADCTKMRQLGLTTTINWKDGLKRII